MIIVKININLINSIIILNGVFTEKRDLSEEEMFFYLSLYA